MARATTSSTDRLWAQIDAAVAGWVAEGLVQSSPWLSEWGGQPLLSTPLPAGSGVRFDAARVERVLRFFRLLRHVKGRAARDTASFRLADWQVRWLVAPVFGLVRADGFRVIRTVWFEIPRKNGKSTIASGLALYLMLADREPGAEVYAAAGDRLQAGIVYEAAKTMAQQSAPIRRKLGRSGILRAQLRHPVTGATFRALSSEGLRSHGLNVHGALVDEVHVHKNPDVVDALETGVGAREQPLVLFITTADDGADGSIYATKREEIETLSGRHAEDPSVWGVVFASDDSAEGFDPFSEETLRMANPGFGVTVLADYLLGKAAQARRSPAQLNRYLRLHLNVRTKQTVRWFPLEQWDLCGGLVRDEEWSGRSAVAGLDLSATTDFTAAAVVARDDDGALLVRSLVWVPAERVDELARRCAVPLRRWAREGWVQLTEGNVVDYAAVRADLLGEVDRLGVTLDEVAYDPWNATETVLLLADEGYTVVPIRQGYASLSPPSKQLERLVFGSTAQRPLLRHGGNPVLRWMADCVERVSDPGDNIKPAKPDRAKSSKRIDGIAALVNALARVEPEDLGRSAYDERGLEVV